MKILAREFSMLLLAATLSTSLFADPNFIVILSDDQGWGTTSVTMDPDVPESKSDFFQTPNIERLAALGMRFTQGYAPHPNCSPSRAALLTGRSPAALHYTDISGRNSGPLYEGNRLIPPQHINALPLQEVTLPELLKKYRPTYKTAHFGKWHLGKVGPEKHGFDTSDGATGNREGSRNSNLPDDPKRIFSMTGKAIKWMSNQVEAGNPFYLQVSHYAPHRANQSLEESLQKFASMKPGKRHQYAEFAAMLYDMDSGIGQVLDTVEDLGIGDNTYIFYTADNGSLPTNDPGNINGPVRGYKASLWEGGVRVPFMVSGPGIRPGSVSRIPVVGYDIYPTIFDILEMDAIPREVEGGSILPVLLEKSQKVKRSRPELVFHWPHYQHGKKSVPDTTILLDGFKLHYFWETGKVNLYHLDRDLAEQTDLAGSMPEKADHLKSLLHAHLKQIEAQLPVVNNQYNPETDPALRR